MSDPGEPRLVTCRDRQLERRSFGLDYARPRYFVYAFGYDTPLGWRTLPSRSLCDALVNVCGPSREARVCWVPDP